MPGGSPPSWFQGRGSRVMGLFEGIPRVVLENDNAASSGQRAVFPWPTMPPMHEPLDIEQQQPENLRPSRRSRISASIINPQTGAIDWAQLFEVLLDAINRRAHFTLVPFTATTAALGGPLRLRPEEPRRYCLIQNTSANQLFVGFQSPPTPANGLLIGAGGFFEPLWVPQDEIWLLGGAAGTTGMAVLDLS